MIKITGLKSLFIGGLKLNRKLIGLISSFGLILVLAVVPIISACTPEKEVAGELVVLRPNLEQEIWGLDIGSSLDREFLRLTNEVLLTTPKEGDESRRQPVLAERWEMSEDGLTWDFYLRKGIQFNEGWGEFTAEDVLFSFQEIAKPGSLNGHAGAFRLVDEEGEVESYEIVDPYHFRIHLVQPTTRMGWMLSGGDAAVVSKKYYEAVGYDEAIKNPIGTGPWRFIEHKPGEYVKYEAVENHWRQTPAFKYLTIKAVPELSARLAMLKTGAADIAEIPAENKAELEAAGVNIKSLPGAGVVHLDFGGMVLPTREGYDPTVPWVVHQDEPEAYYDFRTEKIVGGSAWNQRALKVRMAMYYALNLDAIIDKIFYGEGVKSPTGLGGGLIPFGSIYARPEWEPFPYDPELAKQLLVEAGYPDGFEVRFQFMPMVQQPKLLEMAEAIAMDLEAIGLTVKRDLTEYTVQRPFWSGRESAWKLQLRVFGPWYEPWIGPVYVALTSGSYLDGYESLDLDPMLLEVMGTLDSDERVEATLELNDYFYERFLNAPIVLTNRVFALSPKVGDWPLVIPPFTHRLIWFEYATHAD